LKQATIALFDINNDQTRKAIAVDERIVMQRMVSRRGLDDPPEPKPGSSLVNTEILPDQQQEVGTEQGQNGDSHEVLNQPVDNQEMQEQNQETQEQNQEMQEQNQEIISDQNMIGSDIRVDSVLNPSDPVVDGVC